MRLVLILCATLLFSSVNAAEGEVSQAKATFAGGCFWCMQAEFSGVAGVSKVISGYTGGHVKNPTYEEVSSGTTGHVESIEVTYDPKKVSYNHLLDIFWSNVDPTDEDGQFCDKGSQYHAGIFYHNDEQKKLAEKSLKKVQSMFGQAIATFIKPASEFYPAEEHHQDFYHKNALHYQLYRSGCGRDDRLEQIWKNKPKVVQ